MHRFACVVLVDPRGRLLLQERDEHPVLDPEIDSPTYADLVAELAA